MTDIVTHKGFVRAYSPDLKSGLVEFGHIGTLLVFYQADFRARERGRHPVPGEPVWITTTLKGTIGVQERSGGLG